MQLDPVLLEILNNKVTAVSEEMGFALQRTGRTLYVKETADFATALATPEGRFFAYPKAIGVSGFLDLDCGPAIAAAGPLEPGDVVITNHPYQSEGLATHGPDLHLLQPYFVGDEIVCFGWSFIHCSDVGGRVPSSISPTSSELFQEGFMIPPMKLLRRGEPNADFFRLFNANCRTPDDNRGDLKAMLAALSVGQRRVATIVEQHGLDAFKACQTDLIAYAATKARAILRRLPDGTWRFADYLDDDLVSPYPVRLAVAMTVRDGRVTLDFTGSDPQVEAAFNVPTLGKRHAWLTLRLAAFVLTHDDGVPYNAGLFDSIDVVVPRGTVLNPQFPAAVGVRHATSIRVNDLLNGVLGAALPDVMPACSGGVVVPLVLAEEDVRSGRAKVSVVEPMVGGTGARPDRDGVDGRDSSISNLANNPIETVEADTGVVVRNYALRTDSAGAGRWRGGVGLTFTIEILGQGARVLGRGMERFRFQPWGRRGGRPAPPARTRLETADGARELGRIDVVAAEPGDLLTLETPGGGGYGDPFTRDPERVRDDVRRGLVSVAAARDLYGVAIVDGEIDADETGRLRDRPSPGGDAAFAFGPARDAWESVFGADAMDALNGLLLDQPAAMRQRRRRRVLAAVVPGLDPADPALSAVAADAAAARDRLTAAIEALRNATHQPPAHKGEHP